MEIKELGDELRKGHAFRYLNGELGAHVGAKAVTKPDHTDWELVKIAAKCGECDATISSDQIRTAVVAAKDAESFWAIVAPQIEHATGCRWSPDPL
jgi:hypothetical protein